jgi:hypothetical protein
MLAMISIHITTRGRAVLHDADRSFPRLRIRDSTFAKLLPPPVWLAGQKLSSSIGCGARYTYTAAIV